MYCINELSNLNLFPSTVDEYISIAKEKHGYNVEQVNILIILPFIILNY